MMKYELRMNDGRNKKQMEIENIQADRLENDGQFFYFINSETNERVIIPCDLIVAIFEKPQESKREGD